MENADRTPSAAQGRGWWVCECGHRNTGFAAACYGGCGKDRPETLDDATAQGLEVRLVPKESAAARNRRRRSRKTRRALNRAWYWLALAVPTRVAQALPYPARHFVYKRGIRGI